MMKVDDLVEPRTEQIALAGVPTLLRPHESPRRRPKSSQGITARRPDQFARKPVHNGRNPANTITSHNQKLTAGQRLGSSSRTTLHEGHGLNRAAARPTHVYSDTAQFVQIVAGIILPRVNDLGRAGRASTLILRLDDENPSPGRPASF